MKQDRKKQLETMAEESCKLTLQLHRDCYIAGFIAGAELMLKEMDSLIAQLEKAGIVEKSQ